MRFLRSNALGLGIGLVFGASAMALAAGFLTNGLPLVGPKTVNGVAQVAPAGTFDSVKPAAGALSMDTGLAGGASPQSVATSPWQLAAGVAAEAALNEATATAGAATLNTLGGVVTSEALTTAAGANYTLTLTNSNCTATSVPQVALGSKTNTVTPLQVVSVAGGAGQCVVVVRNGGSIPLNGTILIAFHL